MKPCEMADRTLIVLSYSPWSERARWALDHHGLAYRERQHTPLLGEPRLRRIAGPRVATPTVPVLLAGGRTYTDSWDIAEYADRSGAGQRLVPPEHAAEIRRLCERAERAMQERRTLVLAAFVANERALDEMLPAAVPRSVRALVRPLTRSAARWFGRKYELDLDALACARETLDFALSGFRVRLAGRAHLLDGFSYADIVLCSLLQCIRPVADRYVPLGPGLRAVFTQTALAEEYADLLAWRDRTYAAHRGTRAPV